MNVNVKLVSSDYCYVYSKYKIQNFLGQDFILPEEGATKRKISITENIEETMLKLLEIGKKKYFEETIDQSEIIDFYTRSGPIGFMIDYAMDKYFVIQENLIVRRPIQTGIIDVMLTNKTIDYLEVFFPKLNKKEINAMIRDCKNIIKARETEVKSTGMINENLIYSSNYAEPVEIFIEYAKELYKSLGYYMNDRYYSGTIPTLVANHVVQDINYTFKDYNNMKFRMDYLKQAIDMTFYMQLARENKLFKICNFCGKAFIANNPKSEYDTPQCKNKANVYKGRGKDFGVNKRFISGKDEGSSHICSENSIEN